MAISMLKIRRPLGRLIFNMGIAIPGKTVFLIETAPCSLPSGSDWGHQNGKTTFSDTIAWTLKSNCEFLIPNRLIGRKYAQLFDVSFKHRV